MISVYLLNDIFPRWGMWTLLSPCAVTVLAMLIYRLYHTGASGPLWPLALAMAGFLYLWWLAALLFDLVYVWHTYIRKSKALKYLRKMAATNRAQNNPKMPAPSGIGVQVTN